MYWPTGSSSQSIRQMRMAFEYLSYTQTNEQRAVSSTDGSCQMSRNSRSINVSLVSCLRVNGPRKHTTCASFAALIVCAALLPREQVVSYTDF